MSNIFLKFKKNLWGSYLYTYEQAEIQSVKGNTKNWGQGGGIVQKVRKGNAEHHVGNRQHVDATRKLYLNYLTSHLKVWEVVVLEADQVKSIYYHSWEVYLYSHDTEQLEVVEVSWFHLWWCFSKSWTTPSSPDFEDCEYLDRIDLDSLKVVQKRHISIILNKMHYTISIYFCHSSMNTCLLLLCECEWCRLWWGWDGGPSINLVGSIILWWWRWDWWMEVSAERDELVRGCCVCSGTCVDP